MPLSGSTDYNQTVTDIINKAFFHIGKKMIGMTIESDDYTTAQGLLNDLIKKWQAQGLHLWAKQEGMLYITPNVGEYSLGNYTYFTKKEDQIVQQLTNVSGNPTINVLSTSGMIGGDNIGIVLDNMNIFWTTISSIVDSTTIILTSPIPSTASSGNLVYSFTNIAEKPLRVLSCRLIYGYDSGANSTQREIPMSVIPYEEYWNISATTLGGPYTNQYCYMPRITNGTLYLWPRPNDANYRVQITYERQLEDLDSLVDNFDLPVEWFIPLQFGLAELLVSGYGCIPERAQWVSMMAARTLNELLDWDNELSYVQIAPNMMGYHD